MDIRKLSALLGGRVVAELEANSDHLALRFSDGSALIVNRTQRGMSVVLHEIADSETSGARDRPTRRQREYLTFIRAYMARYGASPAESDIADHFMVSGPSAHQMVKTLEQRGFIARHRDFLGNIVPRSIRVLID